MSLLLNIFRDDDINDKRMKKRESREKKERKNIQMTQKRSFAILQHLK
jgi:hypothetical protein